MNSATFAAKRDPSTSFSLVAVNCKAWHRQEHESARLEIATAIGEFYTSRRSFEHWQLKRVVRCTEHRLYSQAESYEEYFDRSTLSSRITQPSDRRLWPSQMHQSHITPQANSRHGELSPQQQQPPLLPSRQSHMAFSSGTISQLQQPGAAAVDVPMLPNSNSRIVADEVSSSLPAEENVEELIKTQQDCTLLLFHAQYCTQGGNQCTVRGCWKAKQLREHVEKCNASTCQSQECPVIKRLLFSYKSECRCQICQPICGAIQSMISSAQSTQQVVGIGRNRKGDRHVPASLTSSSEMIASTPSQSSQSTAKSGVISLDPISCALYTLLKDQIDAHIEALGGPACTKAGEDYCLLCGESDLSFALSIHYCGNCGNKIRSGAVYYTDDNTGQWCKSCYVSISREKQLIQAENVACPEAWVQCDGCDGWVHNICGLFNSRRNLGESVPYLCPGCLCDWRTRNPSKVNIMSTTRKTKASELPVTELSKFLEQRILRRLQLAYIEEAKKQGVSLDEVAKCPPLVLRQVYCKDGIHEVQEGMRSRYPDYPSEFPVRTKCLLLFQSIDGQDVLLFGLYVYEYGNNCPAPNKGRVYISYLDSVHYLTPKEYKTIVYHEILISYLDYVRARGFHTAHIWSCPPQEGDDYILYVHPEGQKIPKPSMLRNWYSAMLQQCVERGIVSEVKDFYEEFLKDKKNPITLLPYFEGDYWINEAEALISKLCKTGKKIVSDQDPVLKSLTDKIKAMKDDFFVVHLDSKVSDDKHHGGCIVMNLESMNLVDDGGVRMTANDDSRMDVDEDDSKMHAHPSIPAGQDMPVCLKNDTSDIDNVQECDLLDCRGNFLNLCCRNYYQFDQLRRAKHTSMMLLYHLHNPEAPKFAPKCSLCRLDILVGQRKHCDTCLTDICLECFNSGGNAMHMHPLRTITIPHPDELMEEQRKTAWQLRLLAHASACGSAECVSENCSKMKRLVAHGKTCGQPDCRSCKQISRLLDAHASSCRQDDCKVSRCSEIKRERIREMQLRQRQMDDRRRENMNDVYQVQSA
eukprot:gene30926-37377_t